MSAVNGVTMTGEGVQAFDLHALNYSDQWGADPVARSMREEVHRTLNRVLGPNSRVLDLGCGIGLDSEWLLMRGHSVLAVDQSAEMVAQARSRVPGLEVLHSPVESALEQLEGPLFDAAVLDFGVVNCLDLERLAKGLQRCIRPGGTVLVVPMPRLAPAWVLGALRRGRWGAALGRFREEVPIDVEGVSVRTRYLAAREIVEALGVSFALDTQRSLGLSLPPPGSRSGSRLSAPHLAIERRLGKLPLLRRMGDHLLMVFRRELPRPPARGLREKIQRRLETRQVRKTGTMKVLRTLVLELTNACQSRCLGCSYRGAAGGEALDLERIQALLEEAESISSEEVLFTGGEPLLRPDIAEILEIARRSSLRTVLLTNGLALGKHAAIVARTCDAVVVSLDAADPELYREIRGVDGLRAVEHGIQSLRELNPDLPITGRCTVTATNAHVLQDIARYARSLGMRDLSFLAADHDSAHAFGRDGAVAIEVPEPEVLRTQLDALWTDPGPPFISNSEVSLQRILRKAEVDRGRGALHPPRCDAPWTSVVIDSNLAMRPCFFLEAQGDARMGLVSGLAEGRTRRKSFRMTAETACARCVCWARLG